MDTILPADSVLFVMGSKKDVSEWNYYKMPKRKKDVNSDLDELQREIKRMKKQLSDFKKVQVTDLEKAKETLLDNELLGILGENPQKSDAIIIKIQQSLSDR